MKNTNYFLVIGLAFLCLAVTTIVSCGKEDKVIIPDPPTGSKPVAAFIANKTLSQEAESVQFTDQSTNTPTTWFWDFGDGESSTEKNPTHIYSIKGEYSVKLIATNQFGFGALEKADYVKVIREIEVGVSEAYLDLDFTNGTIDNYDINVGTTTISFTGTIPDIVTGTVFTVDMDTNGFLRKVISTQINGNSVTIETEQAFLTDIFVDRDFSLNTEMIEPNRALKSTSTNMEVSIALTDFDGYIHPAEIIYHQKDGSVIKHSAINFKATKLDVVANLIDFIYDFSNTDLDGKQGGDAHLYIKDGEMSYSSNAVFDFDFDYSGQLTEDTRVKKGDLKSFKFYLEGNAGFLTKLALDFQKANSKEGQKKFVNDIVKATVKFLVGPIPVWISFEVDVFGTYSLSADASLHADWGFESNHTIKAGGTYNKSDDSFTPIIEYEPNNTIYPLKINGGINLNAKFEIYPRVEVKFYSFFGPYVEIIPFLEGNCNAAFQTEITSTGAESFLAWNAGLDLGLDLRVGSELEFLWGLYEKEFGPETINCFEYSLWNAPHNIELTSELNNEAAAGSTIPLTFKVTDLLGNPIPLCPVYTNGDGVISKNLAFSDINGEVKINWTLESEEKENTISVTIYNADKSIIKKLDLSVSGVIVKELPIVVTREVTNVSEISALSGGNVISDGNASVSSRGVCWSTSENPTINDSKTTDGTGIGEFTSSITDLTVATTYYVRAYATNSEGTGYGVQVKFTATIGPIMGTFTDSRDQQTYITVTLGNQTWFAENLKYETTNSWWYGNDTVIGNKYGRLYNWNAALTACPSDWHLPSDEEWTTLINYLIDSGYGYDGGRSFIAKSMASSSDWWTDTYPGVVGNDQATNNSSGFNGLPGGYGNELSGHNLGIHSYWWSSSEYSGTYAWGIYLQYNSSQVYRSYLIKTSGFSVRCVKD